MINKSDDFWRKKLSSEAYLVCRERGTEAPYSGKLLYNEETGVYHCVCCQHALFLSQHKYSSGCGWPSFDDAIPGAIKEVPDVDGRRTEIVCANCGAHMGHVFRGEGFTAKNTRHCVNSVSLNFEKKKSDTSTLKKAYFAGGCFWGVEYYLEQIDGVQEVTSGFMGGHVKDPGYYDVVNKDTGHIETVEVVYDPSKVSYETLAKMFFEINPQYSPAFLGEVLMGKGVVYRMIGKWDTSKIYLEKARRIYEDVFPQKDINMTKLYSQLALTYRGMGLVKSALVAQRRAINILKNLNIKFIAIGRYNIAEPLI